ncbi:MAG: deoxyhypusine synthase family protein, partial [Betaproteobacteria bacterium]
MRVIAMSRQKARDVFRTMLAVPRAVIFFGLSGAMVPAGMRKIISTMIRRKMIDVVVSTGANLYHDYYEALGHHHFKGTPHADDTTLEKMDIDRVYDTYMDDRAADRIDHKIGAFVEGLPPGRYSTRAFFEALGETIDDPDSIIRSCHEAGAPLFCPTIHDSGFGIGVTDYYRRVRESGPEGFILDLIRDNFEVLQIGQQADESGAFLIGGGVPKNYIQQI